jgi:hypothetical protein
MFGTRDGFIHSAPSTMVDGNPSTSSRHPARLGAEGGVAQSVTTRTTAGKARLQYMSIVP